MGTSKMVQNLTIKRVQLIVGLNGRAKATMYEVTQWCCVKCSMFGAYCLIDFKTTLSFLDERNSNFSFQQYDKVDILADPSNENS